MRRLSVSALSLLAVVLLALSHPVLAAGTTTSPRIVGYFVQWGLYSRNYRIKQVEDSGAAARLTHLNYAFANVSTDLKCYEETRAGWGDAFADYGALFKAEESVDGVADAPSQP